MPLNKIIFSHSVTGHNLEYIHHIYMGYLGKKQYNIIFVIPDTFKEHKKMLEWPKSNHISFDLMSIAEVGNLSDPWYKLHLRFSLLLRKYIKKHQAKTAFVIYLMGVMPFLPFIFRGKTKISGIIYNIYLYRWSKLKKIRKLTEIVWHTLLTRFSIFDKLYILNDNSASIYFNNLYSTNKFTYLPDPFNSLSFPFKDLRIDYSIPVSKKILFHFGSMGEKKGTLLILESIKKMSQDQRDKYVFVFAGIVQDGIKEQFYNFINEIGESASILIFDKFISFETIANWCQNSDAILIPYLESYQSSGIIGYAAQYKKPVIATSNGLVGKLVRKYRLGITLKTIDSYSLIQAYNQIEEWKCFDSSYLHNNNTKEFFRIINQD